MLTLIGVRMKLRRENLFDTSGTEVGWGPESAPSGPRTLVRTPDGRGTDPNYPDMGSAGARFGVAFSTSSPRAVTNFRWTRSGCSA